ncbi:hypothetical protein IC582_025882 [Cucumis melo]
MRQTDEGQEGYVKDIRECRDLLLPLNVFVIFIFEDFKFKFWLRHLFNYLV